MIRKKHKLRITLIFRRAEGRVGCLTDGKTWNFCFIKKGEVKNVMDEVVDGYELFEANDIQASDDDAIKRILGMFTKRLLTDV